MRRLFASLLCVLLVAATPTVDPGLEALFALDQRVATIGYRLATVNVDLCDKHAAQTGMILHSLGQYAPEIRKAVAPRFTAGGYPVVQSVVADSAAQRDGLLPDDAILAVNDQPVLNLVTDRSDYRVVRHAEDSLETASAGQPVRLLVLRGGDKRTLILTSAAGCASRFQIIPGRKLNASADGTYVQLTGNAANFAANDDELAMLIAHEFAHNVRHHRTLLDRIGRNRSAVRETEADADYWGLYLLVRAGYDGDRAIRFWDRFERKTNAGILADGTHLSRKARLGLARFTLAEIAEKKARKAPLIPEKRRPL